MSLSSFLWALWLDFASFSSAMKLVTNHPICYTMFVFSINIPSMWPNIVIPYRSGSCASISCQSMRDFMCWHGNLLGKYSTSVNFFIYLLSLLVVIRFRSVSMRDADLRNLSGFLESPRFCCLSSLTYRFRIFTSRTQFFSRFISLKSNCLLKIIIHLELYKTKERPYVRLLSVQI